jgi:uncharacterized protein YggU (UPF0235/DUF167 family)
VRVQPKSRRPGLGGLGPDGATLKVAVTEAPEDGRANRAVCAAVAEALHVAPSAVAVVQGAAARQKTLRVAGDPGRLSETVRKLMG